MAIITRRPGPDEVHPQTRHLSSIRQEDLRHVWHPFQQARTYREHQLVVSGGDGPFVLDDKGRRYLDGISGLWNVCLGYSERRITTAMHEQLTKMPFSSLLVFSHEPAVRLAERLSTIAPPGIDSAFFTSGGSEAIETVIKLARHVQTVNGKPLKQKVVSLHGAYHGMGYGGLSLTGFGVDRTPYVLEAPGTAQVPSVFSALRERREMPGEEAFEHVRRGIEIMDPASVAAVIVEPVMGVAGMLAHGPGFLASLAEYCKASDIFLIFDEVATGFGRVGEMLAAGRYAIRPDMIVVAKGITSGYAPLGAVLIDRTVYEICQEGPPEATFMHGFTYGGHPGACAAALATIAIIAEDGLLEKVERDGAYLEQRLQEGLPKEVATPIRRTGLMLAFDLLDPVTNSYATPVTGAAVVADARRQGVILRATYGGFTFNLAPPFICTPDELDLLADVTVDAVKTAMS